MEASTKVSCPFIYANGRRCGGYVVGIEAYKADVVWEAQAQGGWALGVQPRSHFHVFCSEKGNHAGFRRRDSSEMKFFYSQLPDELRRIIDSTRVA